jgi:hypothetical protein
MQELLESNAMRDQAVCRHIDPARVSAEISKGLMLG